MSILGMKTLPVNHPLHRLYQISAGVIGAVLAVFGLVGLLTSGDRLLGVTASTEFCVGCLVAGALLIAGTAAGGNIAAQVNAWTGAILIAIGLATLVLMGDDDWNVLDASMSDVIVLFVIGMLLLAAGFYGQVGEATHAERTDQSSA